VTPRAPNAKHKPPCPARSGRIWKDYSLATARTRRANAAFTGAAIASSPPLRPAHQNLQPESVSRVGFLLFYSRCEVSNKWNKQERRDWIIAVSLRGISLVTADSGGLGTWRGALTAQRAEGVAGCCQSAPTPPLVLELWLRAVETGCRGQSPLNSSWAMQITVSSGIWVRG